MAVWVMSLAGSASASDRWVSDDGVIAVSIPSSIEWTVIEPAPVPMLKAWASPDDRLRLAVTRSPFPSNVQLVSKSIQEGFAKEIGGKITDASERELNGHRVYTMESERTLDGQTSVIRQAVIQHGDYAYKVMAISGAKSDEVDVAESFLSSLEILKAPDAGTAPKGPGNGGDFHELSKRLGGGGVLALIALLIVRRVLRARRAPEAPVRSE